MRELRECYRTLEVGDDASPEEIRQAYLLLVNVWHPDRFAHDHGLQARASEKLKAITAAFTRIKDAPLRAGRPNPPSHASSARQPAGGTDEPPRESLSATEWLGRGLRLTSSPIRLKPGAEVGWSRVTNLNSYFEGMRALREAVRLRPELVEDWYGLGMAHSHLGEPTEAVEAFTRVVRLRPDHASGWIQLGASQAQLGHDAAVVKAFREALRLTPEDPSAWYALGTAHVHLRQHEEAIAAFREAVRLNPDLAEGWFGLGTEYAFPCAEGRVEPEDAVHAFREASRLRPDLAEARCRLGLTLSGLGRHGEAVPVLREAVRLEPGSVQAWYGLGVASLHSRGRGTYRLVHQAYHRLKQLDRREAARLRALLPYHLRLMMLFPRRAESSDSPSPS